MRYILLTLMMLAGVLFFTNTADAKGSVKVGDTIPHNLELKDENGKTRSFSDLTGKKGLVLVFVRSAEWCPYCQKQLIDLSKNNQKFNDLGYNVASISYDALPQIEKFVTKNKPKITMLSDPASQSIRAFTILNTASAKGTMSYGIAHPGVFIIDNKKKVQAKFFESDYKNRPSVGSLIAKIKALNPPPAPNYLSLDEMGQDPIVPGEDVIDIPEKIIDPAVPPTELPPMVPDANDAQIDAVLEEAQENIGNNLQEVIVPDAASPDVNFEPAPNAVPVPSSQMMEMAPIMGDPIDNMEADMGAPPAPAPMMAPDPMGLPPQP